LQSILSCQAVGMVVDHILQTSTGAKLHNEDVGRRVVFFFKVFDILDNVGLGRMRYAQSVALRNTEE
jgi:hypothetical protein